MFALAPALRESARFTDARCSATRGTGPAHKDITTLDKGHTASSFTERRGVYAGHDHAPRSSGRDDGAHGIAHSEQGSTFVRRTHQQVAIRRNQIHEAMA